MIGIEHELCPICDTIAKWYRTIHITYSDRNSTLYSRYKCTKCKSHFVVHGNIVRGDREVKVLICSN